MTLGLAILVSLIMILATIAWYHHNNNPYEYRQHADWVLLLLATHVITLILCTVLAYCEATSGVRHDAIKNRVAEWQIDKDTGVSRFTWKTYDQLVDKKPDDDKVKK